MMEEEFKDINLGDYGAQLAEPLDKVLLIDADTVAFTACLAAEIEEQLLPEEFYVDGEFEELKASGYYDKDTHTLYHTHIDDALIQAEDKLRKIKERTGAITMELHFTTGRTNFRYLLNPEYKANRISRAPEGLAELKAKLLEIYNGDIHRTVEADDYVIYKYKMNPGIYVLTAVDKDVIYSVAGKHWNYYESGVHNIDMKWVEVDDITALKHPFHQTITGDSTDNIKSPRGLGKKTADKILKGCKTEEEMWDAVVTAYAKKGWTEEQAVLVMRQVNLHQLNEKGELELWDQTLLKSH